MKKSSANPADRTQVPADPTVSRAVVMWAQALGRNADIVQRVEAKVRRRRSRRIAAASAAIALLMVVSAVVYSSRTDPTLGHLPVTPTASVTAPRRQMLPDGSIVVLRDGARFSVRFVAAENGVRRVLLEDGEAHFMVAKNPSRPFVVSAGGIDVRAVGTAFAVELGSQQIAVLVTEGEVAVARAAPSSPVSDSVDSGIVVLSAGRRLMVDRSVLAAELPAPEEIAPHELESRLAWRAPRIHFVNTPLSEAVALFNQHSSAKLMLEPTLAELRIGGVVRADNTDPFLRLLKREFEIEGTLNADGTIRLRRP
jgi:transmembrane sensor